jgi:hypothetical protein
MMVRFEGATNECREILQGNHCERGAREGGAWLALPIDLSPSLAR